MKCLEAFVFNGYISCEMLVLIFRGHKNNLELLNKFNLHLKRENIFAILKKNYSYYILINKYLYLIYIVRCCFQNITHLV